MRFLILVVPFTMLHGCVTKMVGLQVSAPAGQEIPTHVQGCSWLTAWEKEESSGLGGVSTSKITELNKTVYLCCPGETGIDPKCYQAKWYTQ